MEENAKAGYSLKCPHADIVHNETVSQVLIEFCWRRHCPASDTFKSAPPSVSPAEPNADDFSSTINHQSIPFILSPTFGQSSRSYIRRNLPNGKIYCIALVVGRDGSWRGRVFKTSFRGGTLATTGVLMLHRPRSNARPPVP